MTTGHIVGSVEVLRRAIAGRSVGLVPTMGALHDGHRSLIQRAAAENEVAVVSIFVNPTQFNDPEDLAKYPRDLPADAEAAIAAGASVIYAPSPDGVYPRGFSTAVQVSGLTDRFEGAARPGHFEGVATVVSILLNSVRPARSYFGEKDFQQLAVVRRMHRDLVLPGEIVGCPTVRDYDGLALSSRHSRLSPRGRQAASVVPRTLAGIQSRFRSGQTDVNYLVAHGLAELAAQSDAQIDYLAIVDPETLNPVNRASGSSRALIAVTIDGVRLLDNAALGGKSIPLDEPWP